MRAPVVLGKGASMNVRSPNFPLHGSMLSRGLKTGRGTAHSYKAFDGTLCNPPSAKLHLEAHGVETQGARPLEISRTLHKRMGQICSRVYRSLRGMLLNLISLDDNSCTESANSHPHSNHPPPMARRGLHRRRRWIPLRRKSRTSPLEWSIAPPVDHDKAVPWDGEVDFSIPFDWQRADFPLHI